MGKRPAQFLTVMAAVVLSTVLASLAAAPGAADAASPGVDGRLLLQGGGADRYVYDLYSANPDGSDKQRLTNSVPSRKAISSEHGTWSPDGSRIAFARDLKGYRREIFVMDADGSDERRLTFTEAHEAYAFRGQDLHWSPDGSRLFYVRQDSVWSMRADGSGQRRLPYGTEPGYVLEIALSPDGQKLALVAWDGHRDDVWTMNSDGSGLTRATLSGRVWERNLDWAPDSSRVAFGGRGIWTVNADGTEPTRLTSNWWDSNPAWSPDGSRVAYTDGGVWTVNADGTGETMIVEEGDGFIESPTWSPDGTSIAFTRRDASYSHSDVHVVASYGSGETTIVDVRPEDLLLGWQSLPAR